MNEHALGQLRILPVPCDLLRWGGAGEHEIDLAGVDSVREFDPIPAQGELDPIREGRSQRVRGRVPGGVPYQYERAPVNDCALCCQRRRDEAGGRLLLVRWQREVEIRGPLDHVRSGRDEEPPVVLVVAVRGSLRDGRRRGQGEPVREIARYLIEPDDERVIVRRLEPGDRIGIPGRVVVESADGRVVERVAAFRPDVSRPLQRSNDIEGDDLRVVERRRVAEPLLEPEGPRQAVGRHLRESRGQVRPQLRSPFLDRLAVVRVERPEQAASVQLPPDEAVVALRIEVEATSLSQ